MKNRMHAETPDVHFIYKYLLIAEIDSFEEPIVCSTFTTYKENDVKDHCALIKVLFHYQNILRVLEIGFLASHLYQYFIRSLITLYSIILNTTLCSDFFFLQSLYVWYAIFIKTLAVIYIYYLFKYYFCIHTFFIQVRENDINNDGQKDSLRFEAHFYTDKPVKALRLLLFFNFQLKVDSRHS